MRFVTFNVQHGRTPAGPVDIDRLARTCAGFEADVLALQEVDVYRPRSGWANTPRRIKKATGMHGVFGPAIRGYGNALFSTEPIEHVENHRLPRHDKHEPRAVLIARTHGVSIAVTHLSIDAAEARQQLAMVVKLLRERPEPRALMGDLNLRVKNATPTWPADNPRIRIDHIGVEGLTVLEARVLDPAPVSDHRPLLYEVYDLEKSSTISRASSSRY